MFSIKIIESGYIMADGGAMFGAVPKRTWQRKYAADAENLCKLSMRCILAISGHRKILIDTGIGDKHLDKIKYYRPHNLIFINEALESLGYTLADITDVVLTHLHFDHCGYSTLKNEKGEIVPSFPNAKYWLSRKQWITLLQPNPLEVDSIFADDILPVYDAGQLCLVDEDVFLCSGFQLRLFDGHSMGQLVPYINTKEGVYTFPGDLIPTSAHVSLGWISAYDISALTAICEKERFLAEAEKEGYTLIYCHDATVQKTKIKKLNNDYKAML